MEVSAAGQDYLRSVFHLASHGEAASVSAISRRMDVSPSAVSSMLSRLTAVGLVERTSGGQFQLSAEGYRAALAGVRRHRLLETFLVQVLGLTWDEVHVEAASLEYSVSAVVEQAIDRLLGYPDRDPHGDPIPPREGPHSEAWGTRIDLVPVGAQFRIDRVDDSQPEALRYLASKGLLPGTSVTVTEYAPFGGPLIVQRDQDEIALGSQLLSLIYGEVTRLP